MPNPLPIFSYGTAVPTTEFRQAGQIIINSAPTSAGVLGWTCITEGTPGTWKPIGVVNANSLATITAASALTAGVGVVIIDGTGPFTLAQAVSHAAGFVQHVKNLNATTLTIVTVAGALHDAAAITLAQYASVTLVSNGTATWHKVD